MSLKEASICSNRALCTKKSCSNRALCTKKSCSCCRSPPPSSSSSRLPCSTSSVAPALNNMNVSSCGVLQRSAARLLFSSATDSKNSERGRGHRFHERFYKDAEQRTINKRAKSGKEEQNISSTPTRSLYDNCTRNMER